MNIALFGFMAVGKTTIGKLLAQKLGYSFIDMDDEIEKQTGTKITTIFQTQGEQAFREIEKKVTKQLAQRDKHIIACGGGAVLNPENVKNLRHNTTLILLTASVNETVNRTKDDETRPLLNVKDRENRINELIHARMPRYLEVADFIVDTTDETPENIVNIIVKSLEKVEI